jgi:addiction module HigA family antidote
MVDRLPNIHPGEILLEEFMEPLGLSRNALARELLVPPNRISKIVKGERSITADTAHRLARYFNTTPEFWMNLQVEYDLREHSSDLDDELDRILPHPETQPGDATTAEDSSIGESEEGELEGDWMMVIYEGTYAGDLGHMPRGSDRPSMKQLTVSGDDHASDDYSYAMAG